MSLAQQVSDLDARVRKLEKRDPPLTGTFIDTATSPSDELRVTVPGWDDGEHAFGPVRWSPIGGALPQSGDEAVIHERDDGVWQVIAWWNDSQGAGVAQSAVDALDARLDAIEVGPEAVILVGTGGAPAFEHSWVNFAAGREVGFYRDRGRVYLEGLAKGGTVGQPLFTLPTGYRPTGQWDWPVISNDTAAFMTISTGGAVVLNSGSNIYVDLSSISFRHD
jgi:hypothetical protein